MHICINFSTSYYKYIYLSDIPKNDYIFIDRTFIEKQIDINFRMK